MSTRSSASAHNLLRDLMALDYELESLSILAKATSDGNWGTPDAEAADQVVDLVEERRRFILKMQTKLLGAALPSLREHYHRVMQHTQASVEDICKQAEAAPPAPTR